MNGGEWSLMLTNAISSTLHDKTNSFHTSWLVKLFHPITIKKTWVLWSQTRLLCATAAKKANQTRGRINRTFTCYTKEKKVLQINEVFVRPHLEYAITAWSPWLRKDWDLLESIQQRATRSISDMHGTYTERLHMLKLTTLDERRIRGDSKKISSSYLEHWHKIIVHPNLSWKTHNQICHWEFNGLNWTSAKTAVAKEA